MREFVDETPEKSGTDINRLNLMALQGYQGESVSFGDTITKINDKNEIETIQFIGNQIIKQFVGERTITQIITFVENGYTKELK